MSADDFRKASDDALSLVLSQAEARVTSQNAFAAAADQRASALLSSSVALTAAAVAIAGVAFVNAAPLIGLSAACAAVGFIIAAANALTSAQCVDFHPLGYYPSNFLEDIASGKTIGRMKAEMADDLEERLKFNTNTLVRRGRLANRAIRVMTITPVVSVVFAILLYFSGTLIDKFFSL